VTGKGTRIVIARIVCRAFFWMGIATAAAIPFVPQILRWTSASGGGAKTFGEALGEALGMVFISVALAAAAVIASLIAFIAAWVARAPRRAKMLCALPALAAALTYGAWVLLADSGAFR
jgi:hypothetical protein